MTESIKIVFVGNSSTGKTSVLTSYIHGSVSGEAKATIAAAFFNKTITIDDNSYDLILWDTAGQEAFRGLVPMYYRGASIAFVLFDITSKKTFDDVEEWVRDVRNEAGDDVVIAVVGNKIDLEEKREVSTTAAQEFAQSINARYYETSAMTGSGITGMIQFSVEQYISTLKKKEQDVDDGEMVNLNTTVEPSKKPGCC